MRINSEWIEFIKRRAKEIKAFQEGRGEAVPVFDETYTINEIAKHVIARFSIEGVPIKVYNLGAGVKRITTETNICPCCKKKL